MTAIQILIIPGLLLVAFVAANLWWREASRRRSLPCPTLLAGALVSPGWERFMGTQKTLDRIELQPGQRVLEIGPGPGRLLIPAARRVLPGGEVVGLDIQPGMVERLKTRAVESGLSNLTAAVGDATKPHFPPRSFDVIYLCTALGEIPNRETALRECFAALKPGGTLSITEIFPDPHYQSKKTVQRLATAAGFHPKRVHGGWWNFTANFTRPEK